MSFHSESVRQICREHEEEEEEEEEVVEECLHCLNHEEEVTGVDGGWIFSAILCN